MNDIKIEWKIKLEDALFSIAGLQGLDINRDQINLIVEKPPKPEMGDLAFPLFPLAKLFKKNPAVIAADLQSFFEENDDAAAASINISGPYINIRIDLSVLTEKVIEDILKNKNVYGHTEEFLDQKVMVEFSCPNTNKPLLVMVPANCEVDLKAVARAINVKKVSMATQAQAESLTGLKAGGISPLALIDRGFHVIIDQSARMFDEIHLSGGQLGMILQLSVAALVEMTNANFAHTCL